MTIVRTTEQLHAALAAGLGPDDIDIRPMTEEEARAEGRALGLLEGQREGFDTAVRAERVRITEILRIAPRGRAAEAQAAIDCGLEPAAFAMAMLDAERERLDPNSHPVPIQVN